MRRRHRDPENSGLREVAPPPSPVGPPGQRSEHTPSADEGAEDLGPGVLPVPRPAEEAFRVRRIRIRRLRVRNPCRYMAVQIIIRAALLCPLLFVVIAMITRYNRSQSESLPNNSVSVAFQREISEVAAGSELYPATSIILTGVCRDVEAFLPKVLSNILKITSAFSRSLVVIFENDSKDQTAGMLKGWAINRNVVLLTGDGLGEGRREARLAMARNSILSYIREKELFLKYDYWINIDMDDILSFSDISPEVFQTTLTDTRSWDVVCANTWPEWYYDRLALRTVEGPVKSEGCPDDSDCHENRPINLSAWFKGTNLGQGIPSSYPSWLSVESCFGGLAIYRLSTVGASNCTYDGKDDCEHVPFHGCINRNGGEMFLNPSLVPFRIPEDTIPHSPAWAITH
eukprot:jgi/Bigna1/77652/fgenesh1_pg.49_\